MSPISTFVAAVVVVLVFGFAIQLLVLAYRYRDGNPDAGVGAVEGDVAYHDDGIDEVLPPTPVGEQDADPDVDPQETDTVPCPRCDTLNEASYTFCRNCITQLSGA